MTDKISRKRPAERIVLLGLVVVILGLVAATATRVAAETAYPRLKIFARVLAHIEASYVDPVDADALVDGAIEGLLQKLDPHSAYMKPAEFKLLFEESTGEFGGVGLEVDIVNDVMTVIMPMAGTPAEQAGIRSRDQIVKIEGRRTRDMSLEEAVRLMRGKPGTDVTVSLRRPPETRTFDVRLTRAVIRIDSVTSAPLEPGYGLLTIKAFQNDTEARVLESLKAIEKAGALKGLVLDLRHNPGGLLESAVKVADVFLDEGDIVTTRGKDKKLLKTYKATKGPGYSRVPMTVLVDSLSASAAEIVAGSLKDHGRAVVVGEKTYGKGSVQTLIELADGSGLKLTVARYYTPSGTSIQAEGILPDITIRSGLGAEGPDDLAHQRESDLEGHLKPESRKTPDVATPRKIDDLQLEVALETLKALARVK